MSLRVPPSADTPPLAELIAAITPVSEPARAAALRRHDDLAKPPGSLGRLEHLGAQLAAIAGHCPPPVPCTPWLLLAAGDHGVHAEGVTAWPQEVTAAIVRTACQGRSVSAVLAAAGGVAMTVLDVGLANDVGQHRGLVRRPVSAGTRNLAVEDAMTAEQTLAAVAAGTAVANGMIDDGADVVLLGEMGITNTTASACLITAVTGAPAAQVTGRGAGAGDETLATKVRVVDEATRRCAGRPAVAILAAVGGFEHAALVGAMLTAAARRIPVVLDGMITNAAALIACRLQPDLRGYLIASHRSTEPGAAVALTWLELEPLVDLGLRLGEGTGALLAAPLVTGAAAVLASAATLHDVAPG